MPKFFPNRRGGLAQTLRMFVRKNGNAGIVIEDDQLWSPVEKPRLRRMQHLVYDGDQFRTPRIERTERRRLPGICQNQLWHDTGAIDRTKG